MAVDLTLKSVGITNREATPQVHNSPGVGGAARKVTVKDYLASLTGALSATSIVRVVEVPAHCRVTDVYITSGAQGVGSVDVGVYRTNRDGGAVVDQDFFASTVACGTSVVRVDILNESGTNTLVKQGLPLWSAVGMTSEPSKGTMLDIALTGVVDFTSATQPIGLEVSYVM